MNFLSHFYFERYCADPDMVLGTVLPDLVKNARKDWNLQPHRHEEHYRSDELRSLYTGWKKHLAVDRHFHNSEFFSDHTRALKQGIVPILEHSPVRPSFLAHIGLELMLDSLLLTENILETDAFYTHLKNADPGALHLFLTLNGLDDPDHFQKFFQGFIDHQYLDSYREAEQIMLPLRRICMRLWADPINETQMLQLSAVMLGYREELKPCFMDIFHEIERGPGK